MFHHTINDNIAGKENTAGIFEKRPVTYGCREMEERTYRLMRGTGAVNIVLGIISVVVGVTSGVLLIVAGSKLLAGKNRILF